MARFSVCTEWRSICSLSIGVYRMNKDFHKKMAAQRTDSALLHHPFETSDKITSYPTDESTELLDFVEKRLQTIMASDKINRQD